MNDKLMKNEQAQKEEEEKKKKKKIHEKSTALGIVRRSPIQALTGLALLNFIEKTRFLCFHSIRTDM